MENKSYVWYLSYGSNLSKERFHCYIQGGIPEGTSKEEKGCRDKTLPVKDESYQISYPLYFSKKSSRWNGGIAFIGNKKVKNEMTYARMYLITEEQFMDVVAQENGLETIMIDLEEVKQQQSVNITDKLYGNILFIGEKDGYPIFTFTSSEDINDVEFKKPSAAYLNTIALGLKETFDLEQTEIVKYLCSKKGAKRE